MVGETKYLVHDSRELGSVVKPESVDCIITSPPYWDLKDYGEDDQIGLGQSYEQYLGDLEKVFKQCYVALKKTGSLWIVIDTMKKGKRMIPIPFDLLLRLKDMGWLAQDVIIWQKDKTRPWSHKGKMRSIFEYVLFLTKDPAGYKYNIDRIRDPDNLEQWWSSHPERYNPKGKVPTGIWHFDLITQGWGNNWVKHACPFPMELVERIVLLTTNRKDTVLDPFAGSGMVLAQASAMGRKGIGTDLSSKYAEMFETIVKPTVYQKYEQLRKEGQLLKQRQINREREIWKRRKLKFGREIVRFALMKDPSWRELIEYIFIRNDTKDPIGATIYVVVSSQPANRDAILELMEKIRHNKMSKFHGNYTVEFVEEKQIKKVLPTRMYLYKDGRFQNWDSRIASSGIPSDWRSHPHIVSNISVKSDH